MTGIILPLLARQEPWPEKQQAYKDVSGLYRELGLLFFTIEFLSKFGQFSELVECRKADTRIKTSK